MMPAFLWTREPDARRRGGRALPRLGLHGQAVPEPRVHGRRRRQPRLGAAPERPARAARDGRGVASARARLPRRRQRAAATRYDGTTLDAGRAAARGDADDDRSRRRPGVPGTDGARPDDRPERRRRGGSGGRTHHRQRRLGAAGRPLGRRLAAERLLLDRHPGRRGRRRRGGTTVAAPGARRARRVVPVADTTGFGVGDTITIGTRRTATPATITGDRRRARSRSRPPRRSRTASATGRPQPAARSTYVDLELPQDVCAAGRVQRFGISSEPSLTSAQAPFATGLSSTGRLTSAAHTSAVLRRAARRLDAGASAPTSTRCSTARRRIRSSRSRPRSKAKGFLTFVDLGRPPARRRARGTTACAASTTTSRPACSR